MSPKVLLIQQGPTYTLLGPRERACSGGLRDCVCVCLGWGAERQRGPLPPPQTLPHFPPLPTGSLVLSLQATLPPAPQEVWGAKEEREARPSSCPTSSASRRGAGPPSSLPPYQVVVLLIIAHEIILHVRHLGRRTRGGGRGEGKLWGGRAEGGRRGQAGANPLLPQSPAAPLQCDSAAPFREGGGGETILCFSAAAGKGDCTDRN